MDSHSTIFTVGLTGGIASGKTSVTHLFQKLGVPIIDADLISREVVSKGSPGLGAIHAQLGDSILTKTGELDRPQLRRIIFDNPDIRKRVESIIHPAIRIRSEELIKKHQDSGEVYVVCAVPLLVEGRLMDRYDRIAVVDVCEETQINRIIERDSTDREAAIKILESQATRFQRLAVADDVIDNEGSLEELEIQVVALHRRYKIFALNRRK